eukprot:CAMPEP_0196996982 /NCGR_PEP_ID=MMETSP1380-20130617/2740_1 /TAXON_ID=5936 /ORGANISM="Euplotes crassus, Strain CT5" /LENGTH=234 /DNA_ID=CAMNT_0042413107 /DNA_START=1 /DNA_END=705 /DNA_ORIENTATION=-
MKSTIVILCILVSLSMGLVFNKDKDFSDIPDVEEVVRFDMAGINFVVDQTHAFSHNTLKQSFTTFNGNIPAFDVVVNFTSGVYLHYNNLTGECSFGEVPKLNLTEYFIEFVTNYIEFAGTRGEHLTLYEIKYPGNEGAGTWLYGLYVPNETGEYTFYPSRFQSHLPNQENGDYDGEWIDTQSFPQLSAADFDYSQCNQTNSKKLDTKFTYQALGIDSDFLSEIMKESTYIKTSE